LTIVVELHEKFGLGNPGAPTFVDPAIAAARMRLIHEEYTEVYDAFETLIVRLRLGAPPPLLLDAMRELLKELADLRMQVDGAAVTMGLPIEDAFKAVHRANMTKLPPDRPGGKLRKGPGYTEPDMEAFVPGVIEGTCEDGD
jgi:NTP pyrophosphatase (non-canonical NTP hydrolase)